MGAYRAAAELGLRIPDDLSLVGFDNQELIAEGLYPALTTVALPHFEMGEWALIALATLMEGGDGFEADTTYETAVLPCPLVRRQSVAGPASPKVDPHE
jgi:LacI family transcriptional regulator